MIPAREVLVHRLSGSGPDGVRILPDLVCHVKQRNHNGTRSYYLSKIGKVSKVHGSPDENTISRREQRRARNTYTGPNNFAQNASPMTSDVWLGIAMLPEKRRTIVRQPIAKEVLVNLVGITRSLEIHADGDCHMRMV